MNRNPHEIADRRIELSAEYGAKADRMKEILEVKALEWKEIRNTVKSDKSADREWDSTPLGVEEMKLRLDMKVIEKKLSAAKSYLDVLSGEARNQW